MASVTSDVRADPLAGAWRCTYLYKPSPMPDQSLPLEALVVVAGGRFMGIDTTRSVWLGTLQLDRADASRVHFTVRTRPSGDFQDVWFVTADGQLTLQGADLSGSLDVVARDVDGTPNSLLGELKLGPYVITATIHREARFHVPPIAPV